MKNILCGCSSVIVNLIEGALAILAVAIIHAFIFEADGSNHDVGLGMLVLLLWLAVLCIPNLLFRFCAGFCKKDGVLFQLTPFLAGAALYLVWQIVFL